MITDAAIATLADGGMRGLTHRAVDRAASLAEGSTSYYFRTRQDLLRAVIDRILELDEMAISDLTHLDAEALADALSASLSAWVAQDRTRLLARYELALQAKRDPMVSAALATGDSQMQAAVAGLLRAVFNREPGTGAPDPDATARQLLAALDGLIFDQLTRPEGTALTPAELAQATSRITRSLLSG